ncbi:aminoglycoside phosphotransferase family protein [Streptomyces sp. C10]|uniref:aminoglycoside phosphotransferase family protein n=1 Tax=Streptomyces sp. C10 TaxID=531941 RepID=UPI00397F3B86
MRLPTTIGNLWFKANNSGHVHEARLLRLLEARSNGCTPEILAADTDRGWFLSLDAGASLESVLSRDLDLRHWESVLGEYGELQRQSSGFAGEIIACGVPDKRPEAMPEILDGLLSRPASPTGTDGALSQDEYDALRALRLAFRRQSARLSEIGILPTIQHDDLTPDNILHTRKGPVFIDWADACIAHPFGSLIYPIRHVMEHFGVSLDSPQVDRIRQSYFEPWKANFDLSSLRESEELAVRLAIVGRADSWRKALVGLNRSEMDPYFAHAEARWLRKLLAPPTRVAPQ